MKNLPAFIVVTFIIVCGLSCKKQSTEPKNTNVYFADADGNKAVYWKNGVEYTLPSTLGARVTSISVSGSDVPFVGFEGPGTEESFPSPAVYWLNGGKHTFPYLNSLINNTSSNFSSLDLVSKVAFSGENIYVASTKNNRAMYWLNGVEHTLPTNNSLYPGSYVNDMVLSGTTIFVAGYDSNIVPSYWKNGVETILPLADTDKSVPNYPTSIGEVSNILVSGQDVYCAGWDGRTVVYWKNGTEHTLPVLTPQTTPAQTVTIGGIALLGSDLYICGIDDQSAVYWKNGIESKLPSKGTAFAAGIAFEGTNVYIVGSDNVNPVYWKNGIEVSLPRVTANGSIGSAVAIVNQ